MPFQPKYYALWDVDSNLIIAKNINATIQDTLNKNLLNAYKQMGITRGVLFTNYQARKVFQLVNEQKREALEEYQSETKPFGFRCQVVQALQREGFIVDNVITPNDCLYATKKQPGAYYHAHLKPLEESIVDQASKASLLEQNELFTQTDQLENDLYNTIPEAQRREYRNKSKGHMFRLFVGSYAEGNVERGVAVIKQRHIVFVFSDDSADNLEAVEDVAKDLGLDQHLITLSTSPADHKLPRSMNWPGYIPELFYYSAFLNSQHTVTLPKIISNIVQSQNRLSGIVNTHNQFQQALSLNYLAFKRLAKKSVNRRSRHYNWHDRFKAYQSNTLPELGEKKSRTLALEFLKLSWLFRPDNDNNLRNIRTHLVDAMPIKRLHVIYLTNYRRYNSRLPENSFDSSGHDYDEELYKHLNTRLKDSPYIIFLKLSRSIDQLILHSNDVVALYRLLLFYATLDASNKNFDRNKQCKSDRGDPSFNGYYDGHHRDTIEKCFAKLERLLRSGYPRVATALQKLQTDIFSHHKTYRPWTRFMPRIHDVYAAYAEPPAAVIHGRRGNRVNFDPIGYVPQHSAPQQGLPDIRQGWVDVGSNGETVTDLDAETRDSDEFESVDLNDEEV